MCDVSEKDKQPRIPPTYPDEAFSHVPATCGHIDTYPLHNATRMAYMFYDSMMRYQFPPLSHDYLNIKDMHEYARAYTSKLHHCTIHEVPDG